MQEQGDKTDRAPSEPPAGRSDTRTPPVSGAAGETGFRRRRLAEARARRMRQARLLFAGGGLLVAVAAVLLLAGSLFAGGEDPPEDGGGSRAAAGDAVLLVVRDGDRVGAAVVVRADPPPALVMGLPADTLLQSSGRFRTLQELFAQEQEALLSALEPLLGASVGYLSATPWSDLRSAALASGQDAAWPEALPADLPEAASVAAGAVAALCAEGEQTKEAVAELEGGEQGARLRDVLRSLSGQVRQADLLPGRSVQGAGFAYYEPDLRSLRARVTGGEGSVEVEVQNGSGVVGVTEAVTAALQPSGYKLLPVRNAEDFPDVPKTRIFAAPGVLGEGERVRDALGVGQVVPGDDLPPGRIVVIVGHDLDPGDLSVPGQPQGATSGAVEQG